jgi:lysine biosynthesis protein LysW
MNFAICPSCDERIKIVGQAEVGLEVTCPSCGDVLEVVSLDPIELDWIYYDDDDDDWEEDDY